MIAWEALVHVPTQTVYRRKFFEESLFSKLSMTELKQNVDQITWYALIPRNTSEDNELWRF